MTPSFVAPMGKLCYIEVPRGAVAQPGERFNGIEEVGGSSPPSSTNVYGRQNRLRALARRAVGCNRRRHRLGVRRPGPEIRRQSHLQAEGGAVSFSAGLLRSPRMASGSERQARLPVSCWATSFGRGRFAGEGCPETHHLACVPQYGQR